MKKYNANNDVPVYFSKIEFHDSYWMFQNGMPVWGDEKIIFLDLANQELSVQVIRTGQDVFHGSRMEIRIFKRRSETLD